MAKAKISKTEFEALHEVLQGEYRADGEDYVLKVDAVGGLELADVSAMRGVIDKNGKAIKALSRTLGNYGDVELSDKGEVAFNAKFSPEDYETLTGKHAELEKTLSGTDLEKKAAERAEQLLREQLPGRIRPLETRLKEREEAFAEMSKEHRELKRRTTIDHTLLSRGLSNPALGKLLESYSAFDDDGNIFFRDDQGQPRYSKDSSSSEMKYAPAAEVLDDWKTQDHLKPFFPSEARGGSGSRSQGSGSGSGADGPVSDEHARLL